MLKIQFDRDRARRICESLEQGQPIQPPPYGWIESDLLTLAGACYLLAAERLVVTSGLPDASGERTEAVLRQCEEFFDRINTTIFSLSGLVMAVKLGEFDQKYEEFITLLVDGDGEGGCAVAVIGERDYTVA